VPADSEVGLVVDSAGLQQPARLAPGDAGRQRSGPVVAGSASAEDPFDPAAPGCSLRLALAHWHGEPAWPFVA
jgi:hypothetical protein